MKASAGIAPFMAFFSPMVSVNERVRSVSFWDAQARWQKAWLAHCNYHQEIISLISRNTSTGWKVLDIGAGSGILALPLKKMGCEVTALEPSRGMRALLRQAAGSRRLPKIKIDGRSWEQVPISRVQGFQLILACNSLHLTFLGFSLALAKIFQANPRHVCVISETGFLDAAVRQCYGNYHLKWQKNLKADSSMAYYSLKEAWDHFRHCWGRPPTSAEKTEIQAELKYQNNLYWLKQEVHLTIWWWSHKNAELYRRLA